MSFFNDFLGPYKRCYRWFIDVEFINGFIDILFVCLGCFGWEVNRESNISPVNGVEFKIN